MGNYLFFVVVYNYVGTAEAVLSGPTSGRVKHRRPGPRHDETIRASVLPE